MDSVRRACLSGGRLENTTYAKTLMDRRLPFHIGMVDDPGTDRGRATALRERAALAGVPVDHVVVATAKSELLKPGKFPWVLVWNRELIDTIHASSKTFLILSAKESVQIEWFCTTTLSGPVQGRSRS